MPNADAYLHDAFDAFELIGVVISAFPGPEEAERSAPGVSAGLLQLPGADARQMRPAHL